MRVLHCAPNVGGGGAERQLTYLCSGLVRNGVDVHVALVHSGCNYDRLKASGATIHNLSPSACHSPRVAIELWDLIRRVGPDIVQTWFRQMDILGGLSALSLRIPWVVSERSSALCYTPTVKHRVRAHLGCFASAVIANSKAGANYWRELKTGRTPPLFVIPNGIPFDEINATEPSFDRSAVKSQRETLLYVGRLSPEKNLVNLLRALQQIEPQLRPACVICGDGPDRHKLCSLAENLALQDDVIFLGYVDNVWAWMKSSKALVCISEFEGHPNAVLEAMACGCQIIASDIPAHREFLDPGTNCLIRPNDIGAIARAIRRSTACLDSKEERVRRVSADLARLSTSAMASAYEHVYSGLLGIAAMPADASFTDDRSVTELMHLR